MLLSLLFENYVEESMTCCNDCRELHQDSQMRTQNFMIYYKQQRLRIIGLREKFKK